MFNGASFIEMLSKGQCGKHSANAFAKPKCYRLCKRSVTLPDMNFCPECGGPLLRHTIGEESRNHWYCYRCLTPQYLCPRIFVTAFVASGDRLLWAQRGLEPQRGKWGIPGGFLELGETLAEGAARELYEEFYEGRP